METRRTEAETIELLIRLLKDANMATSEPTGSCLFRAGRTTYFTHELKESQCDALGGIWAGSDYPK